MNARWNEQGIPHKGWSLIAVYDLKEDDDSVDEEDLEICEMCGNEGIRYVHVVHHPEVDHDFRVGCVCAEKMTDDYVTPGQREKELKNKSKRKLNWIKRKWRINENGNHYLKTDGHYLLIFKDKRTKEWKGRIDNIWGKQTFQTPQLAKVAIFNAVEKLKTQQRW